MSLSIFDTLPNGIDLIQSANIENRGRITETSFAGAGNYDDRFYIGASLGFVRIFKEEQLRYRETVADSSQATLDYFQDDQVLEESGNGFNFRLGVIFRADRCSPYRRLIHDPDMVYNDQRMDD